MNPPLNLDMLLECQLNEVQLMHQRSSLRHSALQTDHTAGNRSMQTRWPGAVGHWLVVSLVRLGMRADGTPAAQTNTTP
jgi:hypothetical protein